MSRMNCPSCGLNVSFSAGERTNENEACPRCLARSSGTISVPLRPGAAPRPAPSADRVRAALRRFAPRRTTAA
jgi:hypothetical protein